LLRGPEAPHLLAALALLSSAVTPILKTIEGIPDLSPSALQSIRVIQSLTIYLEIAGLVGAAIALGGVRISDWKKKQGAGQPVGVSSQAQ